MKRKLTKHGESFKAEYKAWHGMRTRCYTKQHRAYPNYGGRGIVMCDRWRESYFAFLADMGRKPSAQHELDRIDNDKGYEPGNCRWVTKRENNRNRRSTVWVDLHGKRRKLIELCEEMGIREDTARLRLRKGWELELALTTPVRPKAPNGMARARLEHVERITRSGEPGISWHGSKKRWRVRKVVNGKRISVGAFHTIEEAVIARDRFLVRANVRDAALQEVG